MEQQIKIFTSRTGMIHLRVDGSLNALPCNHSGRRPRGTTGTATAESLVGRRCCGKCFPKAGA